MIKREVVVGSQVFDLGLPKFVEAVTDKNHRWPTIELEVGPKIFQVGLLVEGTAVMLNWWGQTSMKNIVWTRFVFLRFTWPFVKKVSAFTYASEGV
jgi:hypothetical protein